MSTLAPKAQTLDPLGRIALTVRTARDRVNVARRV